MAPGLAEIVARVDAAGVVAGDKGAVGDGEGEWGDFLRASELKPFFLGGVPGVESLGVKAGEEASV